MWNGKFRALLALLLVAVCALSACARREEQRPVLMERPAGEMETRPPAQPQTATPPAQPEATAPSGPLRPSEGSLNIEQPSASAAPIGDGISKAGAVARSIDPDASMIALTFDDGPGAGTERILRALDAVGGRATFCMVAERLNRYGDAARQVAGQGSEIATHTWDHQDLTKLDASRVLRELRDSLDAIERTTGVRPTVLRPPYGSVNEEVKSACRELGLKIANWNIDPEDWKTRDAEAVREHVLSHAKDGGIVLCHDLYPETASAMERAIRELDARGYQLVTVSELLEARAEGGEAGRVYYAA